MKYKIQEFYPLISILMFVCILTIWIASYRSAHTLHEIMPIFMGSFFIIFGGFKLANLEGFADAYQIYDLIAQRSRMYAYLYPFIEVGLGIAYLAYWKLPIINVITLVIMSISAIGVAKELLTGREITCACLGALFKIPMTWVTFLEDILMAAMAAYMLLF